MGLGIDDDDRDLLGAMVNLSTEMTIMSYLRTVIALMAMGLTAMLTIVNYSGTWIALMVVGLMSILTIVDC